MIVASSGPYASLHLAPDNHASTPPLSFLQAGCPSCCPTNSVKALKAVQPEQIINTLIGVDFPIATGFSVDKAVVVDACSLCSDAVESELQFVGLIVFENKLKPETAPVIHELQDANIRNVMVTGMHSCFLVSSGSLPYLGVLLVNNNSCLIALAERV